MELKVCFETHLEEYEIGLNHDNSAIKFLHFVILPRCAYSSKNEYVYERVSARGVYMLTKRRAYYFMLFDKQFDLLMCAEEFLAHFSRRIIL